MYPNNNIGYIYKNKSDPKKGGREQFYHQLLQSYFHPKSNTNNLKLHNHYI